MLSLHDSVTGVAGAAAAATRREERQYPQRYGSDEQRRRRAMAWRPDGLERSRLLPSSFVGRRATAMLPPHSSAGATIISSDGYGIPEAEH